MNRFFYTVLLLVFWILTVNSQNIHTTQTRIILENETVRVEFDKEYGTLTHFVYKKTGWQAAYREALAQSFKIYIPTEIRRDNSIVGRRHRMENYTIEGNRVSLVWKGLNSIADDGLEITFTGHVVLNEYGADFSASVSNNSDYTIEAIYWPYFGDFSVPDKTQNTHWQNFNYSGTLISAPLTPVFSSNQGYWGIDYPQFTSNTQYAHFGLIQAADQGLYVGYHDTTDEHMINFMFELRPGYLNTIGEWHNFGNVPQQDTISGQPVHFEFSCVHLTYVNPGETIDLKSIVLYPYKGDWRSGSQFYAEWRKTWEKHLPLPEWANEVHSWQQIHILSAEDRPVFTFSELPEYCYECREHNVRAIQLTGWVKGGQDRDDPSHDIDPSLGTWDELYNAIVQCRQMGVEIVLFTKFTWADESSDWFKDELIKYSVKDPYGNYRVHPGYRYQTPMQLADINTRRLIPMCTNSDEWRKIAMREFSKVSDLGAAGMLYDENQHHGGAIYCFDPSHGHPVPANLFAGDQLLEKDFWKVIRDRNPQFLMVGESNRDLQFRDYHISYFRIGAYYRGMHRFVAPREKMMVAVTGHNDRHILNLILLNNFIVSHEPRNFKGKLSEYPLTLAYAKHIDELRRRYKDYLWDGAYRDIIGATVTSESGTYSHYAVFDNLVNGKRAVVVINPDSTARRKLKIELDQTGHNLVVVSPENLIEKKFNGVVEIDPLSAVVIIEK
jgi:hypothetical protein